MHTPETLADLRQRRVSGSKNENPNSSRTPFQRDRDRILYSTAFRRLAEITQVVRAVEGHHFHNRLTHVLKVAQIGRRIAERLISENSVQTIFELGGLDPDVVEAAGLAHDLGHPPFGHIAEKQLHECCENVIDEAFEGNAQSFRIVTNLAIRNEEQPGLNLTCATLNAILKYPWSYKDNDKKWGYYLSEYDTYKEARKAAPFEQSKTLEAELMDWADDIAYAVYDMDDFYRAGLIPLDRLIENCYPSTIARLNNKNPLQLFLTSVQERWKGREELKEFDHYQRAFVNLLRTLKRDALLDPYHGSRKQRAALRDLTSFLVGRYASAINLNDSSRFIETNPFSGQKEKGQISTVVIEGSARYEVTMLKELTWTYVIENPSLAAQQEGQRKIIKDLYDCFYAATEPKKGRLKIFPSSVRSDIQENASRIGRDATSRARTVIDLIASMTEAQAIGMYERLTGYAGGSMLHRIIN